MKRIPAPEAIRCSICGNWITDGEVIALWSQNNMHNAPPYARVIIPHALTRLHEAYLIGCTAHKCIHPYNNRACGKYLNGRIHTFRIPHKPFGIILWSKWLAGLKQDGLPIPAHC